MITSLIPEERIEQQYQLLKTLASKCAACEVFNGMSPDKSYIYIIHDYSQEPPMLAFTQYDEIKTYAVYAPENITEGKLKIFESFLSKVQEYAEADEQIIVFSQKDYDAIMKYNKYGKPISVKLYA